jgi:predicted nucleic acid-binding Zn ribbon protein
MERSMPEKLLQHKHCRQCGKAVSSEDKYCDQGCKDSYNKDQRSKLTQYIILLIVGGVIIAVTVFMR